MRATLQPMIRIIVFGGLYWGLPTLGNYYLGPLRWEMAMSDVYGTLSPKPLNPKPKKT